MLTRLFFAVFLRIWELYSPFPGFTRQFSGFTRQFAHFTRQFAYFTRQFASFTRQFASFTRQLSFWHEYGCFSHELSVCGFIGFLRASLVKAHKKTHVRNMSCFVMYKSPNCAVYAFVLNPLSAGGCSVPRVCKSSSRGGMYAARKLVLPVTISVRSKLIG